MSNPPEPQVATVPSHVEELSSELKAYILFEAAVISPTLASSTCDRFHSHGRHMTLLLVYITFSKGKALDHNHDLHDVALH